MPLADGKGPGAPMARLYCDEDVDARLVTALRQRGVEVEATGTAGLRQASDEAQLAHPRVHATWMEAGQEHWGIIILIGQPAVGPWLRRMERLLLRFSVEELRNQLLFLGAAYDR
jgi:hypothetical protein